MQPRKTTGLKRLRTGDYACQFQAGTSLVHRLGAGWKLGLTMFLSILAVGMRTPAELGVLLALTLGYYFTARLTLIDLWRDCRFFLYQAGLVILLYMVQYGGVKGFWPGMRVSVQIVLFFLPGAVLLRTTRMRDLMAGLRRVVPYRLTFLVFVSVRFVPFFLRELEEISAAQRLRGARLLPRQLANPRNWPDLFHCLLLPLMVRALKTAAEVSLAAEARGFGSRPDRTYLNPADLEELVKQSIDTLPGSAPVLEDKRSAA